MLIQEFSIRRPKQYEGVLQQIAGAGGFFSTMREALVFCCALGHSRGRRESLDPHEMRIEKSTMMGNQQFEKLVLLIGAEECSQTPEALSDECLSERLRAFEEYACGGLAVVAEELAAHGGSIQDLILSLVSSQVARNRQTMGGQGAGNVTQIFD